MEICGTITALAGGMLAYQASGNIVLAAVAATWAENVGFYGVAAWIELRKYYKEKSHQGEGFFAHVRIFFKSLRNLLTEFGLAELGDTLVVRPAMMTLFQALLGGGAVGILVGKLVADALFYGLAGIGYLLRIYLFEKKNKEQDS
ncbi:MAG: hypothetical protein HOG89_00425 [Candidatus Peribacter sp.]|nr:hypothetical protein [Candidatus Peribacter sp.]MBT4393009.1 hypothetical protein [Candidatus Peribacter sp.]MBT4601069.1 hypothetical protein [Candidatus Peribacter sp.]MBT5149569.1 hypothetical protein [Candidatus Peribacter sp.]MBT5937247.1 hypothetical protein [Candidatus Peribacter sp.]